MEIVYFLGGATDLHCVRGYHVRRSKDLQNNRGWQVGNSFAKQGWNPTSNTLAKFYWNETI